MTHGDLNKELRRYGISTTEKTSVAQKRTKLQSHLKKCLFPSNTQTSHTAPQKQTKCKQPLNKTQHQDNSELNTITTTLSNMDNTMQVLSNRIDVLTFPENTTTSENKI